MSLDPFLGVLFQRYKKNGQRLFPFYCLYIILLFSIVETCWETCSRVTLIYHFFRGVPQEVWHDMKQYDQWLLYIEVRFVAWKKSKVNPKIVAPCLARANLWIYCLHLVKLVLYHFIYIVMWPLRRFILSPSPSSLSIDKQWLNDKKTIWIIIYSVNSTRSRGCTGFVTSSSTSEKEASRICFRHISGRASCWIR